MQEAEAPAHHEAAPVPVSAMEETIRAEAPRIETPRYEEPREEPRYEEPRAEAPRPVAPRVDPKEILSSAGLQMVETDASKAKQPLPEPEPVQLGRPRREKPAAAPVSETELVQVETRNK